MITLFPIQTKHCRVSLILLLSSFHRFLPVGYDLVIAYQGYCLCSLFKIPNNGYTPKTLIDWLRRA